MHTVKTISFENAKENCMEEIRTLKHYLAKKKTIVIVTHSHPDADALGSSIGLYYFLLKLGNKVSIIVPDSYPDFIGWMVDHEDLLIYEQHSSQADQLLEKANLLFCLDFSCFSRIGKMSKKMIHIANKTKVALVDHHLDPKIKPDFNFWDDTAAATAELVYDMIVSYSGIEAIDKKIAECLYAGIMTDTGSFKYSNTTSKTHRIVAELIDLGVEVSKVSQLVYDNNSLSRLRFLGHALSDKLRIDIKMRVAYFVIKSEDFDTFALKEGDTEGLVNYALSIKDIVIAVILIEKKNEIKLSFRSVGDFAVNTFASNYFNGGGHKNASGGSSKLSLGETESKLKSLINQNILNTKIQ